MKKEEKIIKDIVKKYGGIIDLKKNPFIITEILRKFGPLMEPDGGTPCGGVPNPPPPPNPSRTGSIDNSDVMKEVLKVLRQVSVVSKEVKLISAKLSEK
jgi:hypothetical protein